MNQTKVTATVPDSILARLDAISELTGQTRTAVLQSIIPAGLTQIEKLYSDNLGGVMEHAHSVLEEFQKLSKDGE